MLDSTSSVRARDGKARTAVDFNGEWRNELGSIISLKVTADGSVEGTYKRAVGSASAKEEYPLVGFATGALLCLSVSLGKSGSVISWVGQHTKENKRPVIKTMWLLARDVPDPDDPSNFEGAIVTGYNHFVR